MCPNRCSNFLKVHTKTWRPFKKEEIESFIKQVVLQQEATIWTAEPPYHSFTFQYLIPLDDNSPNWWNERIDNWWCKWPPSNCYLEVYEDNEFQISFDTPWSPPEKWLETAVKKFPELVFELEYDEPGNMFCWTMGWKDWEFYDDCHSDSEYIHTCENCERKVVDKDLHEDCDYIYCEECYLDRKKEQWEKQI